MSDGFRQTLADLLMEHHYFREFIIMADSQTVDYENFFERLKSMDTLFEDYKMHEAQLLIDTLLCLISHARQTLTTGEGTKLLVPFLNVHVQLWFREMRRVVATVNENPELKLSDDVNDVDRQQMLPVINCRDCGATGWVSLQTDDDSVAIKNLRDFYAAYFNDHSAICTLIPVHDFPAETSEQNRYYLCPECMKLNSRETCDQCGEAKQIKVLYDRPFVDSTSTKNKDSCPICGSKGGMTFIGARNSTLISAGISEIFASRFNDDKKLLAFSDSVQDASHKAGFFNARTWRFNFRVALQRYVIAWGKGKRLSDFVDDFCRFYEKQMTTEDFITQFIAPNQKWRDAFEYLVENDVLPNDPKAVKDLLNAIKKRLKLEAVYEYGFRSRIGRTLEKSACSILALDREKMQLALKEAYELVINQVGLMRDVPFQVFEQFVYGMLLKLKISGGVYHDELDHFIYENGKRYLISKDHKTWMPGLISSGKVPDFIEKSFVANNRTGFTNFKRSSPYYKWAYKILKDYVNE
ncbi:MAG TPA: hypothetical protein P5107_08270, partial [Thermotogota bacterium]|nr:hypothetical protein [Thermotogota bacterium]